MLLRRNPMGVFHRIWSKQKSIPSGETKIKTMISLCEKYYAESEKQFPENIPHQHLIGIKIIFHTKSETGYKAELERVELENDEETRSIILYEEGLRTRVCACVPPPSCARALAYSMLLENGAKSMLFGIEKYHKDYLQLMEPVYRAFKAGNSRELYCRYNKDPQYQSSFANKEFSFEEFLYFMSSEEKEEYAKGKYNKGKVTIISKDRMNAAIDEIKREIAHDEVAENTDLNVCSNELMDKNIDPHLRRCLLAKKEFSFLATYPARKTILDFFKEVLRAEPRNYFGNTKKTGKTKICRTNGSNAIPDISSIR
jgi:hypothetical protein